VCKAEAGFAMDYMPTHLVEGAIFRTELHAELLRYLQNIINMQFTHQYNHTAQEDAEATKTISYLTLIFLPSTFVCAVFSTTIFNFQNWKMTNRQSGVVSSGWWIFVLTCLVLSLGTVALWIGLKMPQNFRYKRSTPIDSEIGVVDRKAAKSNR
jgi:Mg2+ and Co2+ transporter CorA